MEGCEISQKFFLTSLNVARESRMRNVIPISLGSPRLLIMEKWIYRKNRNTVLWKLEVVARDCWALSAQRQLILRHPKRQKASCQATLKIPSPDLQTKEFIHPWFPLNILPSAENPESVFSFKADFPQGHTRPAWQPPGSCPPLTLQPLNKLQRSEGKEQHRGTKASQHKHCVQLTGLFCICTSAPN